MKNSIFVLFLLAWAGFSFAQVPNYVPTNGLVGWWPFNGNANDESGNGNNGTVNGATLTADRNGIASKAYSFDGTNDFIQVQDNNSLDLSNQFTLCAWYKLTDYSVAPALPDANGNIDAHRAIFGKPRISGWGTGYSLITNPDGQTSRIFSSNFSSCCVANIGGQSVPSLNTWNNVVAVYNGSSLSLFHNGVLDTIIQVALTLDNSTQPLFIGKEFVSVNDNWYRWFKGSIDDIGIWNRALSQCELSNLYNAQVGTSSNLTQSSCNSFTLNNQTYTQSGTYTQNLTNAAGCDSIITLNLTINNSPTASSSSTGATFHGATDGTVNLTVSGGAAPYSFNWSNGANTEDLNAVGAGTYNVTITDANNCSSTTSVTVNQPPLALVKSPESIISSALYPNPATAQTRLDLQLNQAQDFEVAVYNNLGQRIFNKNFSNTKELSENIDMRSWPAGQYFVEIKLPNGTETKKLIKE